MLNLGTTKWNESGSDNLLAQGHQLSKAALLFEKVEDDVIDRQLSKLRDKTQKNEPIAKTISPQKQEISIDAFAKLDIRVGNVKKAEKVERSNKLLKLTIDLGLDTRTIVSGIAHHYTPEEMVGKQVTFIANLAPRKMMDIDSQGMILMAEDEGKLRLLQPDNKVEPGSVVS
jgi:methionyl-tRNA synthetase